MDPIPEGIHEEYAKHEQAKKLKEKWERTGKLYLEAPIIVPRGKQIERGIDVFKLVDYDPKTDMGRGEKDTAEGLLSKDLIWRDVHNLNNPIKTIEDWQRYYEASMGKKVVLKKAVPAGRLMSINDFNQLLDNSAPISVEKRIFGDNGNDKKWAEVSNILNRNLQTIETKETPLSERITNLMNQPLQPGELPRINNHEGRRIIAVGGRYPEPMLIFQGRSFARNPESNQIEDEKMWRGYLQVETEDIPRMVEILNELGGKIANEGGRLDYKYLVATLDGDAPIPANGPRFGEYPKLKDEDPRIALYFKTEQERRLFMRRLQMEYRDDMRMMAANRNGKARRPGTSSLTDILNGVELRHMNILPQAGFSEKYVEMLQATGKDWRDSARGSRTVLMN